MIIFFFFFLACVLTWKAVFTPIFAGTNEEERPLDHEISLWRRQLSRSCRVLLGTFSSQIAELRLVMWTLHQAKSWVLALMKSIPCSLGLMLRELVLQGWEAASVPPELLFLKRQAALCPAGPVITLITKLCEANKPDTGRVTLYRQYLSPPLPILNYLQ